MRTYGRLCDDCKGFNPGYMLNNNVWSTVARSKAIICVSCIQKRLGRPLKPQDFSKAPINYGIFGFDVRTFFKKK